MPGVVCVGAKVDQDQPHVGGEQVDRTLQHLRLGLGVEAFAINWVSLICSGVAEGPECSRVPCRVAVAYSPSRRKC
jgi:hypothetical protein